MWSCFRDSARAAVDHIPPAAEISFLVVAHASRSSLWGSVECVNQLKHMGHGSTAGLVESFSFDAQFTVPDWTELK